MEVELRGAQVRQGIEEILVQTAASALGRFRRKVRRICFPTEVLIDFSTRI